VEAADVSAGSEVDSLGGEVDASMLSWLMFLAGDEPETPEIWAW